MLNTIRVFFSTGITGGLPMSDSPFRTQLTALPLSLTRDTPVEAPANGAKSMRCR
jgi:hypothetical protein